MRPIKTASGRANDAVHALVCTVPNLEWRAQKKDNFASVLESARTLMQHPDEGKTARERLNYLGQQSRRIMTSHAKCGRPRTGLSFQAAWH